MNLMQSLQNVIGKVQSGQQNADGTSDSAGGLGSLANMFTSSGILGPAALGGLVGALLTSKGARGMAGGAILAGGGAALWNKYKQRMQENRPEIETFTPPSEYATRIIRALVYAARSDGHIDEMERQNIQTNIRDLNLGHEAEQIVQQAMAETLDPAKIAQGVTSQDEALQLFTLSCAVINQDHFMEDSYLDALAKALQIPDDVKLDIENDIKAAAKDTA